jgi:4-amino-4-deoxy-L-arabinose transferase-like glycosyltransferase
MTVAARPLARPALRMPAAVRSLAFPALTLLAAVLRLRDPGLQSIRLDEAHSVRLAAFPLLPVDSGSYVRIPSLFGAAAADVHPPGYFLLLHLWMSVVGADPAVLRLPSEVAAILCVPALGLLATAMYGRRVGLIATALGAVSPFWIWHGQEASMYAFLLLFTILSTWALVQATELDRWWGWPAFTAFTLAAVYTHYFAWLVLAAQLAFVVARWKRVSRRQLLAALTAGGTIVLAYLPWICTLIWLHRGAVDPNLQTPDLYTPLNLLSEFLLGYLPLAATSQVVAAWPLLILLVLGLGALGRAPSWRGLLMWSLLIVPLLISFGVSFTFRPLVSERYSIVVTPALYILLAVALAHIPRDWAQLALVGGVSVAMVAALQVEQAAPDNPAAEDHLAAVTYIEGHAQPGDAVLVDPAFNADPFSYYARTGVPSYAVPAGGQAVSGKPRRLSESELGDFVSGVERGRSRLWVIYNLDEVDGSSDGVRTYLDQNTNSHAVIFGGANGRGQASDPDSFRNVQLVLYDVTGRPAANEQSRPETLTEQAALAGVSGSLARPFGPVFGQPATSFSLRDASPPPPVPAVRWSLRPLSADPASNLLVVWNPNPTPDRVQVQAHVDQGPLSTDLDLAAHSELELSLAAWDARAPDAALTVVGSQAVVASREFEIGGVPRVEYGSTSRDSFDGQVWVDASARQSRFQAHPRLGCGDAVIWVTQFRAGKGTFVVHRYLAEGSVTVYSGSWTNDVGRGGPQAIALVPSRVLTAGEYEVVVEHGPWPETGEPALTRHAYFQSVCAPSLAGPQLPSRAVPVGPSVSPAPTPRLVTTPRPSPSLSPPGPTPTPTIVSTTPQPSSRPTATATPVARST